MKLLLDRWDFGRRFGADVPGAAAAADAGRRIAYQAPASMTTNPTTPSSQ